MIANAMTNVIRTHHKEGAGAVLGIILLALERIHSHSNGEHSFVRAFTRQCFHEFTKGRAVNDIAHHTISALALGPLTQHCVHYMHNMSMALLLML